MRMLAVLCLSVFLVSCSDEKDKADGGSEAALVNFPTVNLACEEAGCDDSLGHILLGTFFLNANDEIAGYGTMGLDCDNDGCFKSPMALAYYSYSDGVFTPVTQLREGTYTVVTFLVPSAGAPAGLPRTEAFVEFFFNESDFMCLADGTDGKVDVKADMNQVFIENCSALPLMPKN